MKTKITLAIITGLSLITTAQGQDHAEHHPKTLKLIMADLGKTMNNLNDAIFIEDWSAMEQATKQIAAHPHVLPAEMKAISSALGKDMQKFKQLDQLVHETSLEVVKAAGAKNLKTVLSHQTTIISTCVSCHSQFRAKIQKALSGEKY